MSNISQIADNVAGYDKTSKSGDSKKTSQTAYNRKTIDARKLGDYLNANNVNPENNSGDDISDRISDKRNSARNKAMKLINDAWERDNETSQGIKDMQDSKEAVVMEIREANSKISDIDKELDNLKELYGVEFDSADKTDLTEYNEKVKELNDLKKEYSKQVENGKLSVKAMTESITDVKIDQLKSQDMLDSKEAADTIIEAAEKDIVSMAILEGKEHIDEKAEEAKEKTEEAKEKAEEAKKKAEEAKKKAEEAKEEEAKEKVEDNVTKAQEEIQKLMDINNMIDEDIKGIEIDIQH